MSEYWVYTWLDSHKIRTIDELKASLASTAILYELKQAAELVVESWRTSRVEARPLSLIAGAGIDVLTTEPPREGNPLLDLRLPNLIVTPHIAWASLGAMQFLADQLIDYIDAWSRSAPQNLVT